MNSIFEIEDSISTETTQGMMNFYEDVIKGLKSSQKHLSSKYFYDEKGDILFQKIMNCEDYYLTKCELDIFQNKTSLLATSIQSYNVPFDLIELGAGDATKTFHLLKYLSETDFKYIPIDISGHILEVLEISLSQSLPQLQVLPVQGDYFEALNRVCENSSNRKVLMFLGANIGNMSKESSIAFCRQMSASLTKGDRLIIGFDLKKNPATILKAYNDSEGITSEFNLNLLSRINNELGGNFNLDQFEHYQTYDPENGACKSYLVSLSNQVVSIGNEKISFKENETIYMEVSQKYSIHEIDQMALETGFKPITNCFDTKKYFVDAIWEVA